MVVENVKGLYTFRPKSGVVYTKTVICIAMYTLAYDVSERKQNEIDQSAVMKMDAILDFVSITGTSVS